MSPTMKNIAIALVVITIAYGGYYFYAQNGKSIDSSDFLLSEDVLASTQVFIERRAVLDTVKVDIEIFSDPVFRSYKSFSTQVLDEDIGRSNPFGKTTANGGS